ncbi:hypothetical protein Y032_0031g2243 [Ancylostoma ceylanicum]|uniref:Uncharacterized protein n=1 Tax=Ancylostoma ceylanicum TaxID=53326 RepID=A0A016UQF2_9BILA|nr:hypothetical protein Y032_0031g2243 [Ancylostoma ceylanicum]
MHLFRLRRLRSLPHWRPNWGALIIIYCKFVDDFIYFSIEGARIIIIHCKMGQTRATLNFADTAIFGVPVYLRYAL